jgi:Diaminopimelate epimerase
MDCAPAHTSARPLFVLTRPFETDSFPPTIEEGDHARTQPIRPVPRTRQRLPGHGPRPFGFSVTCVSVGNPPCGVFLDSLEDLDIRRWGPVLENHPAFPNCPNAQFAHVDNEREATLRIWERDAGYTLASGSWRLCHVSGPGARHGHDTAAVRLAVVRHDGNGRLARLSVELLAGRALRRHVAARHATHVEPPESANPLTPSRMME